MSRRLLLGAAAVVGVAALALTPLVAPAAAGPPVAAPQAGPTPPPLPLLGGRPSPSPSPSSSPSPTPSPVPDDTRESPSPTPPPGAAPVGPQGTVRVDLAGGRRGWVSLPADPEGAPVLLLLHGWHNTPAGVMAQSGLQPLAKAAGVVLVVGEAHDQAWAAGACCPGSDGPSGQSRDVTYARALLTAVEDRWHTSATRVAATGFSNGGMMAWRLACQAPDLVPAGVVSVSGPLVINAAHCAVTVPVVQVHGIFDLTVGYQGGRSRYTLTTFLSSARQIGEVLAAQRRVLGDATAVLDTPHPRLLLWLGAHSWPQGGRGPLPDPGRLALGLLGTSGGRGVPALPAPSIAAPVDVPLL